MTYKRDYSVYKLNQKVSNILLFMKLYIVKFT